MGGEIQSPCHDVRRGLPHREAVRKRVAVDDQERVDGRQSELRQHHPGRLVHHAPGIPVITLDVGLHGLGGQGSAQHLHRGDGRQSNRIQDLRLGETPGFPRVQIDRSDVQRTDRQREGVQGAYFNVTERLHEDWPSRMRGSLDVVREHRAAHPQGIPTGSFAQVELQFIDPRSSGVARAHRLCSKWAA